MAHGLAVQAQAAGDLPDRVADIDHAVDLHVPLQDTLDDQRRRQGIKHRQLNGTPLAPLCVLLQAAAVLVTDPLDRPGQALK